MNSRSPSNKPIQDLFRSLSRETSGFTVLEVLISIFMLVIISLAIYQTTTQTYHLRDVLMNEGDFYNGVRLSMGILERDLNLLYTPDIMAPKGKAAKKTQNGTVQTGQQQQPDVEANGETIRPTKFWMPPTDKLGIRPSHFIGNDNSISFIAASHLRVYKDAPESEFAKITYTLTPEKNPNQVQDSQILVKTEDTDAFDELEDNRDTQKFKHTYPLLHGIKKLHFTYYNKEKDKWGSEWDNERDDWKGIYPDIIKVDIEVAGPSRLNFEGSYEFRPEVPLRGLNPSY